MIRNDVEQQWAMILKVMQHIFLEGIENKDEQEKKKKNYESTPRVASSKHQVG